MTRIVSILTVAAMLIAMLALPACRTQDEPRERITRVPAVPPPVQTIPPDMPPPPADQRVPARTSTPPGTSEPSGIGPASPIEPSGPAPTSPPASPGTPATPPAPPAEPPPTEPPPAATSHPELPVLATYTRSGGIAGRTEVLTVYDNGRLELRTSRGREALDTIEAQVDPSELLGLRRVFNDEQFRALQGPYTNQRGADLITYTIRARTDAGQKTVTATDGMTLPAPLTTAMQELERLRARAAAR